MLSQFTPVKVRATLSGIIKMLIVGGSLFFIYRKVLVDNRDTNIKVALDQLQSAHACGTLEQKYEELLSQINKHTNL